MKLLKLINNRNHLLNNFIACLVILVCFNSTSFAQEDEETDQNNLSGAKISVPWSDFSRLLDRIKPDTIKNEPAVEIPAQYVISEAVFYGKPLNDQECLFTAGLSVDVIDSKAWVEIPIGRGLSIFPGVTVNNKDATTGMTLDGMSYVMLHGKGRYEISYSFVAPVTYSSGRFTTTFPLPGQAASRISMDLGNNTYSAWANERPLSLIQNGRNRFSYEGGLGNCTDAIITWQQTINTHGNKDALISTKLNIIYSIAADVIKISSQLNLNIVHNSIRQFRFSIPSNVDIIEVSGNSIATWETRDSAETRIVTVFLKYDIKDNVSFLLHAEMNCSDSTSIISLPAITMQNVIRQEGLIGVGVLSSIEINPLDHSNNVLMRDKRELPEWFSDQGEVIHVYQYLSDNYKIDLELIHHESVPVLNALITKSILRSMIRKDGKMVSMLDLNVRNRGEQFLRVQWKKDYQLWSIYCNNQPSRPSIDTISNELLIPLQRTNEKTIETPVRITYLSMHKSLGKFGLQEIVYPKFNMPVQNLKGALYLPEKTRTALFKGTLFNKNVNLNKKWITSFFINSGSCRSTLKEQITEDFSDESKYYSQDASQQRGSQTRAAPSPKKRMFNEDVDRILNSIETQRDFETGILSIPVQINFKGLRIPFSSLMIKKDEAPKISFLYYQLPPSIKILIDVIVFLLMFLAACALTLLFWSGISRKKAFITIISPVAFSFLLKRLLDEPLDIDLLFIIPAIFLFYRIFQILVNKLKMSKKSSFEKELEEISLPSDSSDSQKTVTSESDE